MFYALTFATGFIQKGKKRQVRTSNQCFQLLVFRFFSFFQLFHIFFLAVTEMTFQVIAKDTLSIF